jgi:hypothetical protein
VLVDPRLLNPGQAAPTRLSDPGLSAHGLSDHGHAAPSRAPAHGAQNQRHSHVPPDPDDVRLIYVPSA